MKINLKDIGKQANNVTYINNVLKLDNYIYKIKTNHDIYDYLHSKGFKHFLRPIETINNIDKFNYIEEEIINESDKAIDLIHVLAYLQNKTTSYEEINLDKVKEKYEEILNNINYIYNYYYSLQDVIERKIYYNPSEYLLLINISLIYENLKLSKKLIDDYYNIIINKQTERKVFIHGHLSLDHFIDNKDKVLISFKNMKKDLSIYDFIYFYKRHFEDLDMNYLFDIYQQRFTYTKDEMLLMLSNILLVDKITIKDSSYQEYTKVKKLIEYIKGTKKFALNQYKKYKKDKNNELQEQ